MTTTEFTAHRERCQSELSRFVDESHAFEHAVDAKEGLDKEHFASIVAELDRLRTEAEAFFARMSFSADTTTDESTRFGWALRSLESALTLARLELEMEEDDSDLGLPESAACHGAVWRARLEELSLQAHLAGMDAQDRIAELHDKLQEAEARIRHDIDNADVERPKAVSAMRAGFAELGRAFNDFRQLAAAELAALSLAEPANRQ